MDRATLMLFQQPTCALCDSVITPTNNSREHIILNSLGGRRSVSGVLCDACNNKSGHDWDDVLADQLGNLALFFGITRGRGRSPSRLVRTASGLEVLVTPDGLTLSKPLITKLEDGNFNIQVRTIAEARQALKGLKRTYPGIDVEKALQTTAYSASYMTEPVNFQITTGGPESGRSIVKSALVLAVAHGVPPTHCDEARSYLLQDGEPSFGYYYDRDLVKGRPLEAVFHCVAVKSTVNGLLMGYVELFGVYRMVVCLSRRYSGPPIVAVYSIDPTSGQELDIEVDLDFSSNDVDDIYAYKRMSDDKYRQAFERVMPIGITLSIEKERKSALKRALKHAWDNCGAKPGDFLTQAHINELSSLVAEQMTPFFLHLAQQGLLPFARSPLPTGDRKSPASNDKID